MSCLVLGLAGSTEAWAQPPVPVRPLEVRGLRTLQFGDVVAGVARSVGPLDAGRAGAWVIRGESRAEVVLTLDLPQELQGPGGAVLPIDFNTTDAAYVLGHGTNRIFIFDPHRAYVNRLRANGRARVYLGGTVRPSFTQAAGLYQAPVTLTVSYTGN